MHPFTPLRQHHDVIDGCMVEAYATHVCQVVKPAALECFRRNVTRCRDKARILALADESGGACYGNRLNRDFKEHVLNLLEPVRGDSRCFILGDRAYECYGQAGAEMVENNPTLDLLSVDQFMTVANQFFDSILNCFIAVYRSNAAICENWQIPLLLELQGTALPSLFGMTFTPEQMDRLELPQECSVHHPYGYPRPPQRNCVNQPSSDHNDGNAQNYQDQQQEEEDWSQLQLQQQQQLQDHTIPSFLKRPRQQQ